MKENIMTALENLIIFYNQLSVSDSKKTILRRALPNIRRIDQLNLYDLAEICYTSPATISRLVKALGYKSYSVFQTKLSECVQRYDYDNRFSISRRKSTENEKDIVVESMEFMVNEFKKYVDRKEIVRLADCMHEASAVAIFGYGIRFIESALQSDLIFSGIPADVIVGDNEQLEFAQTMHATNLALIICPDAVDSISVLNKIMHFLQNKGTKIAILSSSDQQPFLDLADFLFQFEGYHSMSDSFYLQMLLAVITIVYRGKFIDKDPTYCIT